MAQGLIRGDMRAEILIKIPDDSDLKRPIHYPSDPVSITDSIFLNSKGILPDGGRRFKKFEKQ